MWVIVVVLVVIGTSLICNDEELDTRTKKRHAIIGLVLVASGCVLQFVITH